MTTKPLQYDSLRTVLQYLEPNFRFQISIRCPSIRKAEKAVPLHIDSLQIESKKYIRDGPFKMSVNSIDYLIGTIRIYPDSIQAPPTHIRENERGGVGTDLDLFGFEDFVSECYMAPGDVEISEQIGKGYRIYEDDHWEEKEARIRQTELRQYLLRVSGIFQEELAEEIEQEKTPLLPYYHRRENRPKVYTTEVQLALRTKDGLKPVQQFPGKKMYQVEKRLISLFFGGRNLVYVKRLDLSKCFGILRTPVGLKIKAEELHLHIYCICPYGRIRNEPLQLIASSAKKLVLESYDWFDMGEFLEQFTNQIVEVHGARFSSESYLILARRFVETRRPVGTCYSFDLKRRKLIIKTMKKIENELGVVPYGDGQVKMSIDESSVLQITYEQVNEKWRFKFEVVAV